MSDPTINGPSALRRIQLGQEVTPGTLVPATIKFPGTMTLKENMLLHRPKEETGSLADKRRTAIVGESVEGSLECENVTWASLLYLLNMAIKKKTYADTVTPTQVKHKVDSTFNDLAAAMDADPAVASTITFVYTTDKLYICFAAKVRAIRIDIGGTPNAVASIVSVKTSDGDTTWTAAALVRDTTSLAGVSMAQDGVIEFTPDASWLSDTVDGDAGFWIELSWSASWTASVVINEIYGIPFVSAWTFSPGLLVADAPNPFTVEYGDSVEEIDASYVVATNLEIKGAMNEPLSAKVDIVGQNLLVASFTAGLSLPSNMETIVAKLARVYIDAYTGTIGSTEKAATLIDFAFKVNGFTPAYHGSANLFYDSLNREPIKVELDMTLQFNAGSAAQRAIYKAATPQLFRLAIEGTVISGSDKHKLIIDMAGVYTDFSTLKDSDGADTVSVKVEGELNLSTWAKLYEIVAQCKEAVLV